MKYLFLLLFTLIQLQASQEEQINCLALNVYYEARGSSLADQYAVADVVLNRVESSKYPNTVCDVVTQGKYYNNKPIKNKCQFSWWCDGKSDTPKDKEAWHKSILVAVNIYLYDSFRGITENSLHYHADYVSPYWASNLNFVSTIGRHKFYNQIKE